MGWHRIGLVALGGAMAAWGGIRVEWLGETRRFATAGVYARVKALEGGELGLAYSRGSDVWLRKSGDRGANWGPEILVARTAGYSNTNAELIDLGGGWVVYGWNGRPTAGGPFTIRTRVSRDAGVTWGDEALVHAAGSDFGTGCWEPAFLRLPTGELQAYFANEGPYGPESPTAGDQEIAVMTSRDKGISWSGYAVVGRRRGARDGMPVPLLRRNGKGVAVAIEDNGIDGPFKPVLLLSEDGRDWPAGGVPGDSPRRRHALGPAARLPREVYAGAPYIVRLPSGETLLSVQSTEGRAPATDPTAHAVMQVYAGDTGLAFAGRSTPFPDIPAAGNGLWNSLAVLDDSTVMAVSSVKGLGRDGIWTVTGRVRRVPETSLLARPPAAGGMLRAGEAADALGRRWPGPPARLTGRARAPWSCGPGCRWPAAPAGAR